MIDKELYGYFWDEIEGMPYIGSYDLSDRFGCMVIMHKEPDGTIVIDEEIRITPTGQEKNGK